MSTADRPAPHVGGWWIGPHQSLAPHESRAIFRKQCGGIRKLHIAASEFGSLTKPAD